MIPAPRLTLYFPTTRRAWIEAPAVSDWMTVDDVYETAFAWFDLARELRGRELAVEAVNATPEVWTQEEIDRIEARKDELRAVMQPAPEVVFEPEAMYGRHPADDMVRRPWAYDEADPRFEGKAS